MSIYFRILLFPLNFVDKITDKKALSMIKLETQDSSIRSISSTYEKLQSRSQLRFFVENIVQIPLMKIL